MRTALTATALAVAVGDLSLVVFCWRRRSVLAGLLGAAGIPVVLLAIVGGPARDSDESTVVIAGIMLVIGLALYGLGQSLQRLLDREPDDPV